MKITNFKMYPLMIAVSAFLTLSGCDGTTGIISDSGIGTETPPPTTPVPDAGTSTVTASPLTVLADGTEAATVTVTVNDASSNPITDTTVELAQTGSSMISAVTNVGDGTYTFDVTSTTLETVTYTATVDGVTITDTVDVTFRAQTEAECLLAAGGYVAIVNNGRTWLDMNLGASESASDQNDSLAYGDLYQWGRFTEFHELRSSPTTTDRADTIDPDQGNTWDGMFIVNPAGTGNDWVQTGVGVDDNGTARSLAWSTPNDQNQICPCGYVVPSVQDFIDLNLTASNTRDEFHLTLAGFRENRDGNISRLGKEAHFWTTDVNATDDTRTNFYVYTLTGENAGSIAKRSNGYSIRCIKPNTPNP